MEYFDDVGVSMQNLANKYSGGDLNKFETENPDMYRLSMLGLTSGKVAYGPNGKEIWNTEHPNAPGSVAPYLSGGGIAGVTNIPTNNGTPQAVMPSQISNPLGTSQFDLSGITGAVSGLGTTMNTGFNTTNRNLKAGFKNTNQNLTTGFDTTNKNLDTGFNTTNQNLTTGFDTTNQNLTTGFDTTNQNLNTGFNTMAGNFGTLNDQNAARDIALNSYLASLNTGVQDTLSGLGTNLNQVGSNLNTYYGDLSTGQQTLTTGVDNMNSEFGDYRQQYNTDVSSANRKRAEIMESVGGTATQTQDMIAQQGAGGVPYGQQGGQSPYGNPQSPNPQQQSPMMNTVSMAKDVLSSNQNINPQAASMLGDFVSAFSPDGQFIPNGPDANGIPTIRNMNQQGVMQIAKQNAQGQYVTSGVTSQQQIQSLIQAISTPQGLGAV